MSLENQHINAVLLFKETYSRWQTYGGGRVTILHDGEDIFHVLETTGKFTDPHIKVVIVENLLGCIIQGNKIKVVL